MKIFACCLLFVGALCAYGQKTNDVPESPDGLYGAGVDSTMTIVDLEEMIHTETTGTPSVVRTTVTDVCASMGCWMMGKNGHHSTRVIMKDHAFYVPSSLVGKTVLVQGTLTLKRVSEAQRRHYAEDAGATEEEVSGIKGDVTEYVFVASGVKVP